MSLNKGQQVRLKRVSARYGTITNVIAEPDGNDSVVVQMNVRCHASDVEPLESPPTTQQMMAEADRHAAVFDGFASNPTDPERLQQVLLSMRQLGWLKPQ